MCTAYAVVFCSWTWSALTLCVWRRSRKTNRHFLIMSFLAGVGSSLLGGSLDFLGNLGLNWATNSAKESLNKNISKSNLKIQKEYDTWTQQQDKAYEDWWQKYLYNLQNNEYYNLARKYAENTASWAVNGLKKAGLNPILAGIDSNLSSSMGGASPQQSGHKVGGGSIHGASVGTSVPKLDLSAAARNIQMHSAARASDAQADIGEIQKDVDTATKDSKIATIRAESERSKQAIATQSAQTANLDSHSALNTAQADLVRAQAMASMVDTSLKAKNGGLTGAHGLLMRAFNTVGSLFGNEQAVSFDDLLNRQFGINGDSHSAKDEAKKRYVKPSYDSLPNYMKMIYSRESWQAPKKKKDGNKDGWYYDPNNRLKGR